MAKNPPIKKSLNPNRDTIDGDKITSADLVKLICAREDIKELNIPAYKMRDILKYLMIGMTKIIQKQGILKLGHFCTFLIKERKGTLRSIKTGELFSFVANRIKCKYGNLLRAELDVILNNSYKKMNLRVKKEDRVWTSKEENEREYEEREKTRIEQEKIMEERKKLLSQKNKRKKK